MEALTQSWSSTLGGEQTCTGSRITRSQTEEMVGLSSGFPGVDCGVYGACPLGLSKTSNSNGAGLADVGLTTVFRCTGDCFRLGGDL